MPLLTNLLPPHNHLDNYKTNPPPTHLSRTLSMWMGRPCTFHGMLAVQHLHASDMCYQGWCGGYVNCEI